MIKLFRNHWISKLLSVVLSFLMLNLMGCSSFYKVNTSTTNTKEDIKNYRDVGKTLYLHYGQDAWRFTEVYVDDQTLTGRIGPILGTKKYLTTDRNGSNKYKPRTNPQDVNVVNEVHIYISEYSELTEERILIPPEAIQRIDIYDKDVGATVASWVFGSALIWLGASFIILLVLLATKSSCPFIYTWNGNFFEFTGEIYSGAIQPGLERHDYLPLPAIKPDNGMYKIRMTNEVKEIQHTNLAELLVFNTPPDLNVLLDKKGNYHTYSNTSLPVEATNLNGNDVLSYIAKKDSLNYFGSPMEKAQSANDGIIMKFEVPKDAASAKLVVNVKNSLWLDHLFTQFHGMFGDSYDKFQAKQKEMSTEDLNSWYIEQNIPLSVYIEKNGEWEYIDYFNLVGPMAFKEDIIQFDVSQFSDREIKIKLESGYLFWEIDYAGLDFSKDLELNYKVVPVFDAIDNMGNDVKTKLLTDDNEYYIQPEIGDGATLNFKVPDTNGKSPTVILHSKGYYTILREQEGKADRKKLKEFRKADRFSEYSIELFNEFMEKMINAQKDNQHE